MKHTIVEMIFTMMSMLSEEHATFTTDYVCKLNTLATEIHNVSVGADLDGNGTADEEASVEHLMTLAFKETRFGYDKLVNSMGACGVYQQLPKFSIYKMSCNDLLDSSNSTLEAWSQLSYIKKRYEGKLNNTICHYFSGNICGDKDALDYAKQYEEFNGKVKSYLEEAKTQSYDKLNTLIKNNCK